MFLSCGTWCGELEQTVPHVAACLLGSEGRSSVRGLQNKWMPPPEVHTRWGPSHNCWVYRKSMPGWRHCQLPQNTFTHTALKKKTEAQNNLSSLRELFIKLEPLHMVMLITSQHRLKHFTCKTIQCKMCLIKFLVTQMADKLPIFLWNQRIHHCTHNLPLTLSWTNWNQSTFS